jgi:hypothetical protein
VGWAVRVLALWRAGGREGGRERERRRGVSKEEGSDE